VAKGATERWGGYREEEKRSEWKRKSPHRCGANPLEQKRKGLTIVGGRSNPPAEKRGGKKITFLGWGRNENCRNENLEKELRVSKTVWRDDSRKRNPAGHQEKKKTHLFPHGEIKKGKRKNDEQRGPKKEGSSAETRGKPRAHARKKGHHEKGLNSYDEEKNRKGKKQGKTPLGGRGPQNRSGGKDPGANTLRPPKGGGALKRAKLQRCSTTGPERRDPEEGGKKGLPVPGEKPGRQANTKKKGNGYPWEMGKEVCKRQRDRYAPKERSEGKGGGKSRELDSREQASRSQTPRNIFSHGEKRKKRQKRFCLPRGRTANVEEGCTFCGLKGRERVTLGEGSPGPTWLPRRGCCYQGGKKVSLGGGGERCV